MMQDRALKATALQLLASKRWFSQLEVVVLPQLSTGSSKKALTDIDVLGLIPDDLGSYRSILIDCKTLKGQSPVARVLWLRGVMDELTATRGVCVLKAEKVEADHRITAANLDVLLIAEKELDAYIAAVGGRPTGTGANSADIDLWERFIDIPSKYKGLEPAVSFSSSQYWMTRSPAASCRKALVTLRRLRGELDPVKPEHLAVVADMAALFLVSVTGIVNTVFGSHLQPKEKGELSDALLSIVYGGKDTYEILNSMRRLVKVRLPETMSDDLSLPEWNRFVQFIREGLEAPIESARAPLIMREIAWSYLKEPADFVFAKTLANESLLAAKYALLGTEYLCRACKLPPEFASILCNQILALQTVPK